MIYKATKEDAIKLAQMAILMWDENTVEGLTEDFEEILASDESAIYIYD